MPYDPRNPASIFEGDNLRQFARGLSHAQAIGAVGELRDDTGVCMVALANVDLKGGE
jgi:hypothetical protein